MGAWGGQEPPRLEVVSKLNTLLVDLDQFLVKLSENR